MNTIDMIFTAMLDAGKIHRRSDEQKKNLELCNKLQSIGLTAEQIDAVSEIISDQSCADCNAGFHAGFMAALDILNERSTV